jgi:hypothetical protein
MSKPSVKSLTATENNDLLAYKLYRNTLVILPLMGTETALGILPKVARQVIRSWISWKHKKH